MIDTHCHLTYDPLLSQIDAVLSRASAAGVHRLISIGTSPDDAVKTLELTRRYPQVFAAIGLHPHYTAQWTDKNQFLAALGLLASQPKVLAIGETGLDRHYSEPTIDVQLKPFEWQLELAAKIGKPVIIHGRQATDDILPVIRASGIPGEKFVFHCFTGTDAELDAILDLGAYVSFTGVVTFSNSQTLLASSARVPIDRIMIETDAPYLTPAPHRKVKVNEPCYVRFTAQKLAEIRSLSFEDFEFQSDRNADRFFFGKSI